MCSNVIGNYGSLFAIDRFTWQKKAFYIHRAVSAYIYGTCHFHHYALAQVVNFCSWCDALICNTKITYAHEHLIFIYLFVLIHFRNDSKRCWPYDFKEMGILHKYKATLFIIRLKWLIQLHYFLHERTDIVLQSRWITKFELGASVMWK